MAANSEVHETAGDQASAGLAGGEVSTSHGVETGGARLVHRDGVAYVEGCRSPVWRLEMIRRAGRSLAAMMDVIPGLTPEGLDLASAYARQHPEEIDAPIRELGLDDVPPEEEEDDEDEFQADLDELFERDTELFRRLAQ